MNNHEHPEHETSVQALWNAIFSGTKLRHVTGKRSAGICAESHPLGPT